MLEQYSREEALGYMIIALEELNLSKEKIKEIVYETEDAMDHFTEVYAEQKHDKLFGI